jgi:hypothetical protein
MHNKNCAENVQTCCCGVTEGKIPLGRHRHGWKDNVKMDLKEIGWEAVVWIYLAEDRDWWQLF